MTSKSKPSFIQPFVRNNPFLKTHKTLKFTSAVFTYGYYTVKQNVNFFQASNNPFIKHTDFLMTETEVLTYLLVLGLIPAALYWWFKQHIFEC